MVVIAFIISQIWKKKNAVTKTARKEAKVSPKIRRNIKEKGTSVLVARCVEWNIVNTMMWRSMHE